MIRLWDDNPPLWTMVRARRPSRPRAVALVSWIWPPLVYAVLAVILTWPLSARLGDHLSQLGDPLDQVWRLAWGQHQLLHDPWHLDAARVFYPFPRAFFFDELMLGPAIITLPLRLFTTNPVAIYNLAILITFVLSALAMHALARYLGAREVGAFAAGIIYAFAPVHLDRLVHLSLLSGQYFPLIILLLDRLFHAPRPRDVPALAALLALQALSSQYYALYLVPVVGGFVALRCVQERWSGRWPRRATVGALLTAGALAALPVVPVALAYRAVQEQYNFARSIDQVAYYSASLASFVTVDGRNLIWGAVTAPLREQGTYTFERNVFPGGLTLLLALGGLIAARRRPLAQYLALLGAGAALLALGPNLYLTPDNDTLLFSHMPYGFLYFHVPGIDSMRVPARFAILVLLAVAGLAGFGLTAFLEWVARWRVSARRTMWRGLPAVLAVVLCAGVVGETLARPYTPVAVATGAQVPAVYRWLATQPGATVLELPFVIPDHGDTGDLYQYYALYCGCSVVNGAANVLPKGYQALFYELRDGPTTRALSILQGLGVNTIVVHYDLLGPEAAAQTRAFFADPSLPTSAASTFGDDVAYRLATNDRFTQLRALIPPAASVYLSREDPTGAYGGMLARVLATNPIYTHVRVSFGREYTGEPDALGSYDYGILYGDEDPAAAGFGGGTIIWAQDDVVVYRRAP